MPIIGKDSVSAHFARLDLPLRLVCCECCTSQIEYRLRCALVHSPPRPRARSTPEQRQENVRSARDSSFGLGDRPLAIHLH